MHCCFSYTTAYHLCQLGRFSSNSSERGHKPSNIPELERISAAGGVVKSKRVDGDLAVSRGLGDFTYKSNESLPLEQQKVVPFPDFAVYPRNHKEDEFMVIACDGIWDVATNEQCSTFVQELLNEGETDIGLICEEAMYVPYLLFYSPFFTLDLSNLFSR